MTAKIIDGKAYADGLRGRIAGHVARLKAEHGITPGLAVVIVGHDPGSQIYVAQKAKQTAEVGMHSEKYELPDDTPEADVLALVEKLNRDPAIHGILVQLPLPAHLDSETVIQSIRPEKDVDGLTVVNAGKLMTGDLAGGLVSCTPAGAMLFVRQTHGPDLSGLDAVVIGRSNLFGKPMAALLLAANATVTVAHSRTRDLAGICARADILVAAVGRPEMVKADWVKPGATVIDVGINRIEAPERGEGKFRLVGDVAFAECAQRAAVITPVPGGVGPMTIAMLMANTVIAASRAAGLPTPTF